MNCKVKKETSAPAVNMYRRSNIDGGCYTRNPSLGGGTPGGTPVIQILKRGEYVKSLEHHICKVKKETAAAPPATIPRPTPPSILTEGQNVRRILYEEPVVGGAEPPAP